MNKDHQDLILEHAKALEALESCELRRGLAEGKVRVLQEKLEKTEMDSAYFIDILRELSRSMDIDLPEEAYNTAGEWLEMRLSPLQSKIETLKDGMGEARALCWNAAKHGSKEADKAWSILNNLL